MARVPAAPIPRVLAIALGLAALGACNELLGTKEPVPRTDTGDAGDDGAPAAEGGQCWSPVAPGACASCIAASCCAEANACKDHHGCATYESCALACGADYACRAACQTQLPEPIDGDLPALDRCVVASCSSACGVACGVTSLPEEPDVATACHTCIVDNACGPSTACGTSADCQAIQWCVFACHTDDCRNACHAAHPDGFAQFASVFSVLGNACTICNRDGYWECVGKFTWPISKTGEVSANLTLTDSAAHVLPGLTVEACDVADTMCAAPLVTGTSDAQGEVSLPLPTFAHSFGFAGYFDISGPGVPPYLYFLPFPLSEPSAALPLLLATPARLADLTSSVVRTLPDGGTAPFTPDPTRGAIAVIALDCVGFGAGGVTFAATSGTDETTLLRYYDGQTLGSAKAATDRSGLAFFLDVPARALVTIEATPGVLGHPSSRVQVFTRPGAVSLVNAIPTP